MSHSNSAKQLLINALQDRQSAGLLRSLSSVAGMVDFCSNDYLGLAKDKDLANQIAADQTAWQAMQDETIPINGSSGSRLISGNHPYIEEFEKQCAEFHHAEAALLFGSGFEANLGLISALAQKEHVIFVINYCMQV